MKKIKKTISVVFSQSAVYIGLPQPDVKGNTEARGRCIKITAENIDHLEFRRQFVDIIKKQKLIGSSAIITIEPNKVMSFISTASPINRPDVVFNALRLDMEKRLELDIESICFDYNPSDIRSGEKILALLTLKDNLELIKSLAAEVKLNIVAITVLSDIIGNQSNQQDVCSLVVSDGAVEVAAFKSGKMTMFKYINRSKQDTFLAEIQKTFKQYLLTNSIKPQDLVCNIVASGTDITNISNMFADSGIKTFDNGFADSSDGDFAAAIIAQRLCLSNKTVINFNRIRNFKKRNINFGARFSKAISIAAIILILCGIYINDWRKDYQQLNKIRSRYDLISVSAAEATEISNRISQTKEWFSTKPVYLNILKELTFAFPEEGSIWLTSLASDRKMNNVITGYAVEEKIVLDVLDEIKKNPKFKDIRIVYIRKSGQTDNTAAFAFNFKYSQD